MTGLPQSLAYEVKPGERVALDSMPTDGQGGIERDEAEVLLTEAGGELAEQQELIYGAAKHAVLIVLQGLDTSGKDGTIRRAFTWLNPQASRVVSFKAPTEDEAAHDFLWRVHRVTPARGFITIFNRSHYEDVLVPRVRDLCPETVWSSRYQHINNFERLLTESGTIVIKFFLHISKQEQKQRLLDREREPDKSWKLAVSDWEDRYLWDAYTRAYEDLLERCSTLEAPWYVVPADRKWYRDLVVASTVVQTLRRFRPLWAAELDARGKAELEALKIYRSGHPRD
jgi:PPK2 family polyphosphate:nucleotide phosphotransferase